MVLPVPPQLPVASFAVPPGHSITAASSISDDCWPLYDRCRGRHKIYPRPLRAGGRITRGFVKFIHAFPAPGDIVSRDEPHGEQCERTAECRLSGTHQNVARIYSPVDRLDRRGCRRFDRPGFYSSLRPDCADEIDQTVRRVQTCRKNERQLIVIFVRSRSCETPAVTSRRQSRRGVQRAVAPPRCRADR